MSNAANTRALPQGWDIKLDFLVAGTEQGRIAPWAGLTSILSKIPFTLHGLSKFEAPDSTINYIILVSGP